MSYACEKSISREKSGTCTIQQSRQEFDNVTTPHYPFSTCIRKSVKSNVSGQDDRPINQLSKSVVYSRISFVSGL